MNRENMGWFVAGALLVMVGAMGAAAGVSSVGRYQVVSSRYRLPKEIDANEKEVPITIRIDTVTGASVPLIAYGPSEHDLVKRHPDLFLTGPFGWGVGLMTFSEHTDFWMKATEEANRREKDLQKNP